MFLFVQASSNILESTVLLASTSLNYHRQQRVLTHPVVVHCLTGSGKTALFILIAAAMAEVNLAGGNSDTIIPDMVSALLEISKSVFCLVRGYIKDWVLLAIS